MASLDYVPRITPSAIWRLAVFGGLAVAQVFLTSIVFKLDLGADQFWNPALVAHRIARFAVLAFLVFCLAAWPLRQRIIAAWREVAPGHNFKFGVALNIGVFTAMLVARYTLSTAHDISWLAAAGYGLMVLSSGASLALVLAPAAFWNRLLRVAPVELIVAATAAMFAMVASWLAQESWTVLADATLRLSYSILSLYETRVEVDNARSILGVGDFRAEIGPECSGYEGVGLVIAFLAAYIWIFRRDLAFPNAWLLFPIGIATIWVLNAVRIAALISIGAHVAPDVAVIGFHSQAGWMIFLVVTIGLIAVSRQVPFFHAPRTRTVAVEPPARPNGNADLTLAFLAPFMALMATSIVAFAMAPHDRWLYPLKVIAVGATVWAFRDAYLRLLAQVSPLSLIAGVVVGVVWVVTDPAHAVEAPLGTWLATLPTWVAIGWLGFRIAGSVILVPIAEELAFRGYLHRALIAKRFETVEPGRFALLAFIVSSAAFGIMHQRWLSAALAGAVYALLMYRTNRISDPVAAHMASNAVIVSWAIINEQWSLL